MNTKVKLVLTAAALMMAACADMSVDPTDSVSKTSNEILNKRSIVIFSNPDDFNIDEYIEINPDIKYNQIAVALRSLNAGVEAAVRTADDAAFLADTASAHLAYKMAGFDDAKWPGTSDSLMKEQKNLIKRFNLVQVDGVPNAAKDLEFIKNFQYDADLWDRHYQTFGAKEGRPYRKCTASDPKKVLKSADLANDIGSSTKSDYSEHYFCLDADGNIYKVN